MNELYVFCSKPCYLLHSDQVIIIAFSLSGDGQWQAHRQWPGRSELNVEGRETPAFLLLCPSAVADLPDKRWIFAVYLPVTHIADFVDHRVM